VGFSSVWDIFVLFLSNSFDVVLVLWWLICFELKLQHLKTEICSLRRFVMEFCVVAIEKDLINISDKTYMNPLSEIHANQSETLASY
jgi:hypothetical protein